jgi:hypothetical protein
MRKNVLAAGLKQITLQRFQRNSWMTTKHPEQTKTWWQCTRRCIHQETWKEVKSMARKEPAPEHLPVTHTVIAEKGDSAEEIITLASEAGSNITRDGKSQYLVLFEEGHDGFPSFHTKWGIENEVRVLNKEKH